MLFSHKKKSDSLATPWYRDKIFTKKLLILTLPIAFQNLMLAAVAAADAIMLGSVEQNAMSAISMATQIQFVQNMALSAMVSAFIILAAQYWGKGDKDTVNRIFWMALRFNLLISLVVFAGCVFFPRFLMTLFTDEIVLIDIGADYLKIAGWSYLLTGISQCYLALLKVSEHPDKTALVSTGAVLLNIGLNAVFIYGLFGLPRMEAEGAALATLISRIVELIWAFLYTFKKGYLRPQLRFFPSRSRALRRDFRRCMLPILGACMLWGVGYTSYTAFMGHLGTDVAAANSVAAVVRDLVLCLCNGLASGANIIVGNELGAGNLERGKQYGRWSCRIAYSTGFLSTAVMLLITPALLALVKLTDGAKVEFIGLMLVMSVYMIGRVVNTIVINGVFYAGGDTLFDVYSLAITMWGIAVPLAAAGTFLFHWPAWIVYACTCLDEVGKIPWVMYHYRKYKWVKDLTEKPDELHSPT